MRSRVCEEAGYAKNSEPNVMVVLAARSVSMTIPDLADAISGIGSSIPVAVAAAGTWSESAVVVICDMSLSSLECRHERGAAMN